MAEAKNEGEEHALPPPTTKRKLDPNPNPNPFDTDINELQYEEDLSKKRTMLQNSLDNNNSSSVPELSKEEGKSCSALEPPKFEGDVDEEDYEVNNDDEGEDEDEDEDEHSNGQPAAVVDRKGKGIMKDDDKGKGKLIEDDSSEDDDEESDIESDGESDLSEDPLAEVDLDNILPSRTRRRVVPPGVYISNQDQLSKDEDDRDSDDSDA